MTTKIQWADETWNPTTGCAKVSESGKNARPMHPDWVRSLRDQCASAKVPFLFKQFGTYRIANDVKCDCNNKFIWGNGKKWTNGDGDRKQLLFVYLPKHTHDRMLDGRIHDEYPKEAGK